MPDQFKGRARRARKPPPDVAVRRRHALVQTGVILGRRHRRRHRTTMPPHRMGGAPIPNHEAPHRMGGHGNTQRSAAQDGRARERTESPRTRRHGRKGPAPPAERRTTAERSGRGGTAPTSARPRYAADPDRRPRCHRRTSSSTPTRLAQVAGAGSTDRHTRESAAEPPQRPPPRPRSSVSTERRRPTDDRHALHPVGRAPAGFFGFVKPAGPAAGGRDVFVLGSAVAPPPDRWPALIDAITAAGRLAAELRARNAHVKLREALNEARAGARRA